MVDIFRVEGWEYDTIYMHLSIFGFYLHWHVSGAPKGCHFRGGAFLVYLAPSCSNMGQVCCMEHCLSALSCMEHCLSALSSSVNNLHVFGYRRIIVLFITLYYNCLKSAAHAC